MPIFSVPSPFAAAGAELDAASLDFSVVEVLSLLPPQAVSAETGDTQDRDRPP